MSLVPRPKNPPRPLPGQESVWDYPRPAICEPTTKRLRVVFNGKTIADTTNGKRVLETSHPPTYYFPIEDIDNSLLHKTSRTTFCEWKGNCAYYNVVVGDKVLHNVCWYCVNPVASFKILKDHVAFYARDMDACFVNEEKVIPQAGTFYGGWITSDIVGPLKGEPGTNFW